MIQIQDANDRLIITYTPWGSRVFCLLFIPFGLFLLAFSSSKGVLKCERTDGGPGQCSVTRSNVYGLTSSSSFTTDQITQVRVQSPQMKGRPHHFAQVCLPGRNILISDEQASIESVTLAVNALNRFKSSPEVEHMEVTVQGDFFWRWIGLFLALFGVGYLLAAGRRVVLDFDLASDLLDVRSLGKKEERYGISRLSGADVLGQGYHSRLTIFLRRGASFTPFPTYWPMGLHEAANTINRVIQRESESRGTKVEDTW